MTVMERALPDYPEAAFASVPEQGADMAAPLPETRLRAVLIRRLQDVVAMPGTRITPHERQMAADLLLETLAESDVGVRRRCAERLVALTDAPKSILRRLAVDVIDVAQPLLEGSEAFDDSDLIATIRDGEREHRLLIARRKQVREAVADALVALCETDVMEELLRNAGARLSGPAIDRLVKESRDIGALVNLLLRRSEVTPTQAYTLFWWCDTEQRRRLLRRFAAERLVLQDALADLFPRAMDTNWADPLVRKTLQFVERRQCSRSALARSPYASLEDAIQALNEGVTAERVREVGFLAGLKPAVIAQILSDISGDAVAILCKATALKRPSMETLWRTVRRSDGDLDADQTFRNAIELYDSLSTNKAQTILRYWNWSLTAAMSPAAARGTVAGEVAGQSSAAAWSASLVFGARG
jgi:uncharacterized protein (DUF2336 family)